jgi:hypothetical protein
LFYSSLLFLLTFLTFLLSRVLRRIFIGFQWVLLSIQFFAQEVIDDVPSEVQIQLERTDFINEKVIEKVADEDFGVMHVEEEQDIVEANKGLRSRMHCGNLCGLRCKPKREMRSVRSRVIRSDLAAFPQFDYPGENDTWPHALSSGKHISIVSGRDQKAAAKAAALARSTYQTGNYISPVAAVAAPSAASVAAVGAAGAADSSLPRPPSTTGSGYSAVPAPGYN